MKQNKQLCLTPFPAFFPFGTMGDWLVVNINGGILHTVKKSKSVSWTWISLGTVTVHIAWFLFLGRIRVFAFDVLLIKLSVPRCNIFFSRKQTWKCAFSGTLVRQAILDDLLMTCKNVLPGFVCTLLISTHVKMLYFQACKPLQASVPVLPLWHSLCSQK